jgi:hypothetical protein
MEIIDTIISILTPTIPVLVMLLQKRLEGLKTKLIAIQGLITGVWTFASSTFLPWMCGTLSLFCGIQDTKTFGFVTAIVSIILLFLRQAIGKDEEIKNLPQRFTADYKHSIQRLRSK